MRTAEQFMDPHIQLEAYRQRARRYYTASKCFTIDSNTIYLYRMVAIASKTYQEGLRQGLKQTDAWNYSTCDWNAAATVSRAHPFLSDILPLLLHFHTHAHIQAHVYYVVLNAFNRAVQSSGLSTNNQDIMEALCALFATFGIVKYAGDFMIVSNQISQ